MTHSKISKVAKAVLIESDLIPKVNFPVPTKILFYLNVSISWNYKSLAFFTSEARMG